MVNIDALKQKIQAMLIADNGDMGADNLQELAADADDLEISASDFDRLLQAEYQNLRRSGDFKTARLKTIVSGDPKKLFEKEIHSLYDLGQLLFDNGTQAKQYLFFHQPKLMEIIRYLSNHDPVIMKEFDDLCKLELTEEVRFLKFVYLLNPQLPYKLEDKTYKNIVELLNACREDYSCFNRIREEYNDRRLLQWPATADCKPLEVTLGVNSPFLQFIYGIDKDFPFYIAARRFETPETLMREVMGDYELWEAIDKHITNNEIYVWFEGIGRTAWITKHIREKELIDFYIDLTGDEKSQLKTQKLVEIILPDVERPQIVMAANNILEIDRRIQMGRERENQFTLLLVGRGFVRANITVLPLNRGLATDVLDISFFHLGKTSHDLVLFINTMGMGVRKLKAEISIDTDYQKPIKIPVRIKIIFPVTEWAKYGIAGAFVLLLFRFFLGKFTGNNGWAESYLLGNDYFNTPLQVNQKKFNFVFILMIFGFFSLFISIKKVKRRI